MKYYNIIVIALLPFLGFSQEVTQHNAHLQKIEDQYGEQWDFCTCVVKHDSINKVFMTEMSDEDFDRVTLRYDEIERRCKAFLVLSPMDTPEERENHQRNVKACLEADQTKEK